MYIIPRPACNRRASCTRDFATNFRCQSHERSITKELGPERNFINFLKLCHDLVKIPATQMGAEACWIRGTLIRSPVSLQLLNAEVTLGWEMSGVCKFSGACVSWALHTGQLCLHRGGQTLGFPLSACESQMIPGSRSKRRRCWLGMWVCPLPVPSSFVLSFHCKMIARAAMWKCGPGDICIDLAKPGVLLNFSEAFQVFYGIHEAPGKGMLPSVLDQPDEVGVQFVCFELIDTEKPHLLEKPQSWQQNMKRKTNNSFKYVFNSWNLAFFSEFLKRCCNFPSTLK